MDIRKWSQMGVMSAIESSTNSQHYSIPLYTLMAKCKATISVCMSGRVVLSEASSVNYWDKI